MILACTGHRPSRSTFPDTDRVLFKMQRFVEVTLMLQAPKQVITGMAMGFDTAVALACANLTIPFIAAVPFIGQELRWSAYDRKRYESLIGKAARVEIVTQQPDEQGLQPADLNEAYFARNRWMVDNATKLLALHDGRRVGGTFMTVRYAEQQNKPVENLWKKWVRQQAS